MANPKTFYPRSGFLLKNGSSAKLRHASACPGRRVKSGLHFKRTTKCQVSRISWREHLSREICKALKRTCQSDASLYLVKLSLALRVKKAPRRARGSDVHDVSSATGEDPWPHDEKHTDSPTRSFPRKRESLAGVGDSLFRGNDRLGRRVVRAVRALDDFSLKNASAAVGLGLFGGGGRICIANALACRCALALLYTWFCC